MPESEMPTAATVIEIHESRIARLEDGFTEVSTGLAVNAAKVDALGDKIDASHAALGEKIENCIGPLASKIDAATAQLATGRERIVKLEERSSASRDRWRTIKRIVVPAAVASSGWLGHHIWSLIFHSHGH